MAREELQARDALLKHTGHSDLDVAVYEIVSKRSRVTALWNYYWGNQPLRYSSSRLKEMFGSLDVSFVENWCGVVVDSTMDRINLSGFVISEDKEATNILNDTFNETELILDADDAHLAALVTGESFIFVWKSEENGLEAYYNDPRLCHIEYKSENPRQKKFAAKMWVDEETGLYNLVMYYPDRLEYYKSKVKWDRVRKGEHFIPSAPTEMNPYGEIPVFHLRRDRIRIAGELDSIITLQDAVNKLFSDMMVAAEFGAFPQRYLISTAEVARLRSSPGLVWDIPAADGKSQPTEIGQLPSANLDNYLRAMDKLSQSISVITRTPRHYFWGQTGPISGEALLAMESPLNKKIERYTNRFASAWRKVAVFILRLEGKEVPPADIVPHYDSPQTVQPKTMAEMRKLSVDAGMPLITVLKQEGWTEPEIEDMIADAIQMRTMADPEVRAGEAVEPSAEIPDTEQTTEAAVETQRSENTVDTTQWRRRV